MKRFCLLILSISIFFSSAWADGTRQLMPNKGTDASPEPKGNCYVVIGAQEGGNGPSRPFARYNYSNGKSANDSARLHINIRDYTTERIRFGFGDKYYGERSSVDGVSSGKIDASDYSLLKYRIKDPDGNIVFSERSMPTSGNAGYINTYKEAYIGPKIGTNGGYNYLELIPTKNGDYYIEFDNGSDIGATGSGKRVTVIGLFDVSVVDKDSGIQKEGRVWSLAWGLTTNHNDAETYTTFYTISTDHYVSKVYLDGWEPYNFVVACNSYGSQNTGKIDVDRKSKKLAWDPSRELPEYKIFLTQPSQEEWGEAHVPNVPSNLTFAGDAITCEDLIFVIQLLYNENATLELFMDVDKDGISDKVIAALLQTNIAKDRGFHYPWKDTVIEEKKTVAPKRCAGMGIYNYTPTADGCTRDYTLSLFDQTYKYQEKEDGVYKEKRINPGDTIYLDFEEYTNNDIKGLTKDGSGNFIFDDEEFVLNKDLGTEENPIFIQNKDQLDYLAKAINETKDYPYTIEDYYILCDTTGLGPITSLNPIPDNRIKSQSRTFSFGAEGCAAFGFENFYFYLTKPITLDSEWLGIGTEDNAFRGTFRSGRYNPNPVEDNSSSGGLSLEQNTITLNNTTYGLFTVCQGATIENIHIAGSINAEFNTYGGVGGICDYAIETNFKHCTNSCNITYSGDAARIGGILGYGTDCYFDTCYNYGHIDIDENYPQMAIGGIVGYIEEDLEDATYINFCFNNGIISSQSSVGNGGIVGFIDGVDITNCRNDGSVLNTVESGRAAGILGNTYDGTANMDIHSCVNNGNITADYAAGICASDDNNIDIEYCMNTDTITGYDAFPIAPEPRRIYHSISTTLPTPVFIDSDGSGTYEPEPITDANKEELLESLLGYVEEEKTRTIKVIDHIEVDEDTGEETIVYVEPDPEETYYEITPKPGMEDSPFMLDGEGRLSSVTTACCGSTVHSEDAGRLFDSKTKFYIKWDGKTEEGDCVTGEVTVNYQKNSGVTHFPFYDAENNRQGKGLIVYRISPITGDTLTAPALSDTDPSEKNEYGYQCLPKNHFQTTNYDCNEKGIELNLFWDDTNIDTDTITSKKDTRKKPCGQDNEKITENGVISGVVFGEKQEGGSTYTAKSVCTACSGWGSSSSSKKEYYEKKSDGSYVLTTVKEYKCTRCGMTKTYYTKSTSTRCVGISNLDYGGYKGSTQGGHLFPQDYTFGDTRIINTWWNGVEVKQSIPLTLEENQPAILHNEQVYGILPVSISLWEATNLDKSVLLEWSTASEENNDYFTIERSFNGVSWVAIGKVNGAGTTTVENFYSFEDKKPVEGISYYRLKQTDYNGEYSYSSVKCINRPKKANDSFVVYTNHEANAFIVEGEVIAACPIEVYSTTGARVYNVSFNTISVNKVLINVKDLPAGSYFVKICNGSKAVIKNW